MFLRKDIQKIDEYLHAKFPEIYEFNFGGIVLLYGGAIKNIIMDEKVKDLDFLIIGERDNAILDFIKNYGFEYKINAVRGYKILADMEVDLRSCFDLHEVGRLSTNCLFYDIKRKQILSVGFIQSVQKAMLFDYYYYDQIIKETVKREIKAGQYLTYFCHDKYKIKRYYFRSYELSKYFIKKLLKKIIIK